MRSLATFFVILALAAAAIWYSVDPRFPIAEGLDLRGGVRVTLEPDYTQIQDRTMINEANMKTVRDVIENRVNSFGLSGTVVQQKGNDQVLVMLPGAKNPEEALKTLVTVAQLEFWHLKNVKNERNLSARYEMKQIPGDPVHGVPESYEFLDTANNNAKVDISEIFKESELILKGSELKPESKGEIDPQSAQPIVTFELKPEGARVFGDFTTKNQGEILAIVLDKRIISAPRIDTPITEGSGRITGGFANMVEARLLANLLNSGSLPIPLKPAETQVVGATLGQQSVNQSVRAGLIGVGLVLAFMLVYYALPGFLACIALLFYSAFTFAIFKGIPPFPPIVLDLPGITGFILSVGMAVDANVLIFERLKEEVRAGKPLQSAIDAGFNRAFSSILDSNVTTWIVCAILIWLGAPMIKGFAVTLALGVAVSMFTAITVTRTLLHVMTLTPWARNPALYGLNHSWLFMVFPGAKEGGVLNVFANRKFNFAFSGGLAVIALIFLALTPFGKGLQAGIDFTGGMGVEAAFRNANVTQEDVQNAAKAAGLNDAVVSIARSNHDWSVVTVTAKGVDQVSQGRIKDRLASIHGFDATSYTGTSAGDTFTAKATFTEPVTETQVRTTLNSPGEDNTRLDLKELKVAVAAENHSGANAIPVALIQTQNREASKRAALRTELEKLGGGIVEPMYSESFVGPSVAKEVTWNAFASVAVASLAIILYLAFRFAIGGFLNGLKFGVSAIIALIHDVGIVLGIFALLGEALHWRVDSLFVTAALTILGFSVHDTIVVYDRIRENLHHRGRGETFAHVSDRSTTQTFDRSINTSMTVLLVVAALAIFGGESTRHFNVALLIGIALGTYSSIFIASPLVVLWDQAQQRRAGVPVSTAPARPAARPAAPRRETVAATPRPKAAEANGRTDGVSPAADDAADETRTRSTGVRPKRKRRL